MCSFVMYSHAASIQFFFWRRSHTKLQNRLCEGVFGIASIFQWYTQLNATLMALHWASAGFIDNWFNGFFVVVIVVVLVAMAVILVAADVALVVFIIIYIARIRLKTLYHLMLLPTLVMQFSIAPAFPFDEMYRCCIATQYTTTCFKQYHLISTIWHAEPLFLLYKLDTPFRLTTSWKKRKWKKS